MSLPRLEASGNGYHVIYRDLSAKVKTPPGLTVLKSVRCEQKNCCLQSPIKSIFVRSSVREIGDNCFGKPFSRLELLSEVTFERGSKLNKIGNQAFAGTNIKTIRFPKSLTEIGSELFLCCGRPPSKITFENGTKIKMVAGMSVSWTDPSTIVLENIAEVPPGAFRDMTCLKKISFNGTTPRTFGTWAFSVCNMKALHVPKSVETIEDYCFYQCAVLEVVVFEKDAKLRKLGKSAFACSGLMRINLPKSVEEIDAECFSKCNRLATLTMERGIHIRKIGKMSVNWTNPRELSIPKEIEEIELGCFDGIKSLRRVSFDGSMIGRLWWRAFAGSGLKFFICPKSIRELPFECFAGCKSLHTFLFEEGSTISVIPKWSFLDSGLESFRFPITVHTIGESAFHGCKNLREIIFEGDRVKTLEQKAFEGSNISTIYVPLDWKVQKYYKDLLFVSETSIKAFFRGTFVTGIRVDAEICTGIPKRKEQIPDDSEDDSEEYGPETNISSHGRDYNHDVVDSDDHDYEHDEILESSERDSEKDYDSDHSVEDQRPLSDFVIDISSDRRVRSLGSGGFGDVYLYQKGDSLVAAKFIRASDEKNQTVFERETENLRTLSHPFIVGFRGFSLPSEANANNFVVIMEYISGGSLQEAVKGKPSWLDDTAKAIIIYGIASGMAFVHSKGIIHRDLKLTNVLLDEKHFPRICDFGSSRLFSLDETMTAAPSFTARYAAPELYDTQGYTEKVDVYSFGVILYEILTGQPAFEGFSQLQLIKHIAFGKREMIPPTVTPFGKECIEKCWSQHPTERPSFEQLCSDLKTNAHLLVPHLDGARFAQFLKQRK